MNVTGGNIRALANRERLAFLLIVVASIVCYANSFRGAFVLDDIRWIVEYPAIRQLWPPWHYLTDTSRPLVNLTLAFNYAGSGQAVWSYHLFNLVIHILASLTLFGLVRRTLLTDRLRERFGDSALGIALAAALLWEVHPMQTESVTYIIQRAESMMGFFYLATIYCTARSADSGRPRTWQVAAVLACLGGMLTKPVMVSAPVTAVLYDVIFLGGSFRKRWRFYASLAASWLALAWVLHSGASDWERSAGYTFQRYTPLQFAMTQPSVVLHYLRLAVWPSALCLDYGWPVAKDLAAAAPATLAMLALLGVTVWLLWRKPAAGFVGAWFFLTLAPSSSFVPIGDLAFEHRMYLPLASVTVVAVLAGARLSRTGRLIAAGSLGLALTLLTIDRNADYRSALAIWQDTVAKAPHNARAHENLGKACEEAGRLTDAMKHYGQAVVLEPRDPVSRYNLATTLAKEGKLDAAIAEFEAALALCPNYIEAHYNLGIALSQSGRPAEAREHFEGAARLAPQSVTIRRALEELRAKEVGP